MSKQLERVADSSGRVIEEYETLGGLIDGYRRI